MSMSPFLDAIGVISGFLGIIDFFKSNLPPDTNNGANFRVKVGHADWDLNFGGKIGKIMGYDGSNALIGSTGGSYIPDGGFTDYTLKQDVGGIQTSYATIIGTDDAICISWITLKNTDGALDAAWTGDVGWQCGKSWHYGNQTAGTVKDTGAEYKPKCTWIDADHTNGLETGAIKINFPAYGRQLQDTINSGTACSKTMFAYNAAEIDGVPGRKRSEHRRSTLGAKRPKWVKRRLVVSNAPEHSATELCTSETSWGPDFVGSDGYYCNMETRELFPLCGKEEVEDCVSVDLTSGKILKRANLARRSADLHVRSYEDVQLW